MNNNNAPHGRKRTEAAQGQDIHKRGEGLGTGKVGSSSGYQGRPGTGSGSPSGQGGGMRSAGAKGGGLLAIIAIVAVLIFGKGKLFGGGGDIDKPSSASGLGGLSMSSVMNGLDLSSLFGSFAAPASFSSQSAGTYVSPAAASNPSIPSAPASDGWTRGSNTGKLDTTVASGSRAKYTALKGDGKDVVTLMIYMCGTDLESKNGMATADLMEMTKATLSDKVNIIIYTGGCKKWTNSIISSSKNQIYKVEKGGLVKLVDDDGSAAMTNPATLSSFIKYCATNYPASRNELIFWDHGGGSISGYGYDEKNPGGSMNLTGINKALYDGGVKFDFVGFDACLMATAENALMLSDYADYLIASEETEPGVGWYYTNWLTKLSADTSMPTVELGKLIVDDFVDVCRQTCGNALTTLSVIDLAELEHTFPAELKSFAKSTVSLIQNDNYKTVSDARGGSREFSSKIDQVDLVHLATNIGTSEGEAMVKAILGAVKYNRTSSNMKDAYGLSIYFPYRKTSTVNSAVRINEVIGMDADYNRCIEAFASVGAGGQAVSSSSYSSGASGSAFGSAGSPLGSLLGSLGGAAASSSSSASGMSSDMISSILGGLMNGSGFFGRSMNDSLDMQKTALYIADNQFDANLVWVNGSDNIPEMQITPKQWSLVQDLLLNVFYDDGKGFIDLGLDNVFYFKENEALVGAYDGAWLSINGQAVAYYFISGSGDENSYVTYGRIPVMINGARAELLTSITETSASQYAVASVDGVRWIYPDMDDDQLTVAKSGNKTLRMNDTDTVTIDFICDYYNYDGTYQDSYKLGEPVVLKGTLSTEDLGSESDVYLFDLSELNLKDAFFDADAMSATYRFTDMYGQQYWTPVIP